MKRNNPFGLWQRCRVCGTIFPDRAELRTHLEKHAAEQPEAEAEQSAADELWDEPQQVINYPTVSQPARFQQPARAKKFSRRKFQRPQSSAQTLPFQ